MTSQRKDRGPGLPTPRFSLWAMLGLGLIAPATTEARVPDMRAPSEQATLIHLDKSDRLLRLFRDDALLVSYEVSLGSAPEGPKGRQGDKRTPTGRYTIDGRNAQSAYYLSLRISYPNAEDRARAAAAGVSPGGDIMIHGMPNGLVAFGAFHLHVDWTDGCIAVTNAQMQDIWSRVPTGTPIVIEE